MLKVIEVNQIDELGGYRLAWNALLRQTRDASFFQSLDWLETYWRHFGEGQRLRVLIVGNGTQVLGILPLVTRSESTRAGSLKVLTYPLDFWSASYGPVGPNPTATLVAGLEHIHRTKRDWDVIDLRWTHSEGWDRGRTARAMRAARMAPTKSLLTQTAAVDLRAGWDSYWTSRKSHWRTNVRRSEKKLAERGEVEFIRYRPLGRAYGDSDPRWDLYDACERIARNSWQGTSTTGTTLTHEHVRAFFRESHSRAIDAGALDLNLLLVAGVPAAFAYNYHYQGAVTGVRMGFDYAVAREGAGTVLQLRMLQNGCELGDHHYDLGPEYLECKRHWQTSLEDIHRYTYYAPAAWRAQAIRCKRAITQWLRRPAFHFGPAKPEPA